MKVEDVVKVAQRPTCDTAVYRFLIDHNLEVFRKGHLVEEVNAANPLLRHYNIVQSIDRLFEGGHIARKQILRWNYYGSKDAIALLSKKLVEANQEPERLALTAITVPRKLSTPVPAVSDVTS